MVDALVLPVFNGFMKVKIGSLELSDVTPDELDALVKKYGKIAPGAPEKAASGGKPGSDQASTPAGNPNDVVALRRFVEAGSTGVRTKDIGELLGKQGKAIRSGLREWSRRVKLSSDDNEIDTFEQCRVGTARGVRIKSSLLDVARMLLSKQ